MRIVNMVFCIPRKRESDIVARPRRQLRVHAKYYGSTFPDKEAQQKYEQKLYAKTKGTMARSEAEIILLDNTVAVYRSGSDVTFYVVGSTLENEIILAEVLSGLFDSLSILLRDNLEKRVILDHLELVFLIVDELVDGGVILETDGKALASRVLMKGSTGDTPLSELTIGQAFSAARGRFSNRCDLSGLPKSLIRQACTSRWILRHMMKRKENVCCVYNIHYILIRTDIYI